MERSFWLEIVDMVTLPCVCGRTLLKAIKNVFKMLIHSEYWILIVFIIYFLLTHMNGLSLQLINISFLFSTFMKVKSKMSTAPVNF